MDKPFLLALPCLVFHSGELRFFSAVSWIPVGILGLSAVSWTPMGILATHSLYVGSA